MQPLFTQKYLVIIKMSFHPILGIRSSPANLILQRPLHSSFVYPSLPRVNTQIRAGYNGYDDGGSDDGSSNNYVALSPCEYTLGTACPGKSTCTNDCYQCKSGPGWGAEAYSYCNASTEGGWMTGHCPNDSVSNDSLCPQYKID